MTSFGPDRTYTFGRRWADWDGRDDWEPDLDDLFDDAEDHRNESRIP